MFNVAWMIRSVHILAAMAWVGGSLMYLLVVNPALRASTEGEGRTIAASVARRFKQLVNVCTGILILSGVYLTVERLTQTLLGWPYLIVLCVKVIAAVTLFLLAFYLGQSHIRRLAKRVSPFARVAPHYMLALGILISILGALLNFLYEQALALH